MDLTALKTAAASLDDALLLIAETPGPPRLATALRDSAIQRFEYTYELAVKSLRRALRERSAVPNSVDSLSFHHLLRDAASARLVADPVAWMDFRDARNQTSYGYDEATANEVATALPEFARAIAELIVALEHDTDG